MKRVDVAVVGAGVIGAATAFALAEAGRSVVLLEQFHIGHLRGSSHGPARIFRFSYPDPTYVAMAMEALPLWRELESRAFTTLVETMGGIDVGSGIEGNAAALAQCGAEVHTLDAAEAMARWPSLSLGVGEPVVYQPDAGVIAADKAWAVFVGGARAAGAELIQDVRVEALSPHENFVNVSTGETTYSAGVAVVTAGAWARRLLALVGIDLDVRATRETVAYFARLEPRRPTLVEWGDPARYALVSGDGIIKAGEHIAGPEIDPSESGQPDPESVERVSRWVTERFTDVEPKAVRTETCLYTNTPDEHFVLERHGNIVVGSPCSGHGFKFAPLIGRRLAALALDQV